MSLFRKRSRPFVRTEDSAAQKSNMNMQVQGTTLTITGVKELGAANSQSFRDQVRAAFVDGLRDLEIDLSQAMFVDSCGLGALISLHKSAATRQGLVRLLNPTPPVQQILELTRMHRIFDIVTVQNA